MFLPPLVWYYCYRTVLSSNIWLKLELELEPEPKLWTKVEPESEPKINNFGSVTLEYILSLQQAAHMA